MKKITTSLLLLTLLQVPVLAEGYYYTESFVPSNKSAIQIRREEQALRLQHKMQQADYFNTTYQNKNIPSNNNGNKQNVNQKTK